MQFNDYLMKRLANALQIGQNNGKTETPAKVDDSVLQNASLFSSLSAEDLANIDFEQLLASGVGSDDNALNNVLKSFLEIDGIQQAADADESGDMSAEEAQAFVQSILGKDGDASTISMEDLDAVVQELGIDLESLAASMDEVLNEDKTEEAEKEKEEKLTPEQIKEAEEKPHPEKTEKATAPQAAGGAGGAGSAGGGGGVSGGGSNVKKTEEAKGETPDEIKQQIQEKKDDIEKIEGDADKEIEDQEKAKEKAMKQYGVSDEEMKKYQDEEKKYDDQIKAKEGEIKEQDGIISDAKSTIKSNESYIKDIDAQIASNKEAASKVSEDDDKSQKSEIESKITNLENEKQKIEDENKKLEEETIKQAEDKKTELKGEIEGLEKDKQELLKKTLGESKGFCSGLPSDAKEGVTNQILQYDDKIKDIKEKRDKDVAEAQKDVTKLEAKLKTAEEKEKRGEFLKENSAVASSLPENIMQGVLEGKEDLVCEIAERYGLEPAFLAAIIGLESGWGTSPMAHNNLNFGGVSGTGDAGSTVRSDGHKFAKYSSVEAGLDAMAKNLAGYTKYDGVNSVDIDNVQAIGRIYCEGGEWANKVSTIYNQLKAKMG